MYFKSDSLYTESGVYKKLIRSTVSAGQTTALAGAEGKEITVDVGKVTFPHGSPN